MNDRIRKISALASEITDPVAEARKQSEYANCGMVMAQALSEALVRDGWRKHIVRARFPNHDRMSGSLSTCSEGVYDHWPNSELVIRITCGRNERAGTSWGYVEFLSGDELIASRDQISEDEERRRLAEEEEAALASLPPVAIPGIRDGDLEELNKRSGEMARKINEALMAVNSTGHVFGLRDNEEIYQAWSGIQEEFVKILAASEKMWSKIDDAVLARKQAREKTS